MLVDLVEDLINTIRRAAQWVFNWIMSLACAMFFPIVMGAISVIPDSFAASLDWTMINTFYTVADAFLPLGFIFSTLALYMTIAVGFFIVNLVIRLLRGG